eukprot:scaffold248379_cov34-Cyclotella_meneghiniana.AAC.1
MSNEHEPYEIAEGQFDDASLATGLPTQEDDEYSSADEHLAKMVLPPVEDTSTSVKPTDSILKAKKKSSPLDRAKQFFGLFVEGLRWDTQKTAYRQFGEEYLRQYSQWYHESQNMKTAEALSAYRPGSCKVNTDFLQPCDRVREGTAYQFLLAVADAKCNEWSLERGSMHLKVRRMNNDAKREIFIELAARSMWRMARILLSTILSVEYGAHNLVADMLTLHNAEVLKEMCSLEEFITLYRKINKCDREVEDPDVICMHGDSILPRIRMQASPSKKTKPLLPQRTMPLMMLTRSPLQPLARIMIFPVQTCSVTVRNPQRNRP